MGRSIVTEIFDIDNLPDELKALDQWVTWSNTKHPMNAKTGRAASVNDPSTWASFEKASEEVKSGKRKGVGFVFTESNPYTGIDLDHVIDPKTGDIEPWAQAIVNLMASYTEISQSGTGLHIIVRGKKPGTACRKGQVEIYDHARYFALTGNLLDGAHA